jgi:hypothetical protein
LSALGSLRSGPSANSSIWTDFLDAYRRRQEWNDRFAHWEKSESDSETQRIERARDMVMAAIAQNDWLRSQRIFLAPQGSFTNRTNTRLEADIDLRVQGRRI